MSADSSNPSSSLNSETNEQHLNVIIETLFNNNPSTARRASEPNCDRFRDSSTSNDTTSVSSVSDLFPQVEQNVTEAVERVPNSSSTSDDDELNNLVPEYINVSTANSPDNFSNVIDVNAAGPSNFLQHRHPQIHGIKRPNNTNKGPYGKRACFRHRNYESSESDFDDSDEEEISLDDSYDDDKNDGDDEDEGDGDSGIWMPILELRL